jgi:hypothetical protein
MSRCRAERAVLIGSTMSSRSGGARGAVKNREGEPSAEQVPPHTGWLNLALRILAGFELFQAPEVSWAAGCEPFLPVLENRSAIWRE